MKDPVYGCVGAISVLQRQVMRLQKELDATNADLMRFTSNDMSNSSFSVFPGQYGARMGHGGGSFDHNSGFSLPYASPWNNNPTGGSSEEGGDGTM